MHRQFVNDPGDVVFEALEGFELCHRSIVRWNRDPSFVIRAERWRDDKVGLVSGGGSGHEPLHVGFVGAGMLDAAVPGRVFASPSIVQVEAATRAVASSGGAVQVVKNYTGDVLNFGIAAEAVAADGIPVETVLVDDDLATDALECGPGRRGTAAVLVVEKVCGAAAELGASLDDVASIGRRVAGRSRSLAVALSAGTHFGEERPSFELEPDEMEFGVGIHGERGIGQRPFAGADDVVSMLAEPLVGALGLGRGDAVLVIVNGLGSTHLLEQYIVHRGVSRYLAASGIEVARALVGSYVTSLDMSGCSLTLVPMDEELVALWDAPVHTAAWRW